MFFTSILTTCKSGSCKSEKWSEISNHKAGGPWLRLWQWIVAALLPCLPALGMAAGDGLELKSTTAWDLTRFRELGCNALSQNKLNPVLAMKDGALQHSGFAFSFPSPSRTNLELKVLCKHPLPFPRMNQLCFTSMHQIEAIVLQTIFAGQTISLVPKKYSCVCSRGALHHQPGSASPQGRVLFSILCYKYGPSFAVKFFFVVKWGNLFKSIGYWGIPIQPLQMWLSGSPWVQWSATSKADVYDKGFMCQKPKSHLAWQKSEPVKSLICPVLGVKRFRY